MQNGSPRRHTKALRMLAEQLREDFSPKWFSLVLHETAMGRDFRVTLINIDPKTGEQKQGRPIDFSKMVQTVPTLEHSLLAIKMILERRDGMPVQQTKLDAEMRARVATTDTLALEEKIARMTPDERQAYVARMREQLRALDPEPEQALLDAGDPDVPPDE